MSIIMDRILSKKHKFWRIFGMSGSILNKRFQKLSRLIKFSVLGFVTNLLLTSNILALELENPYNWQDQAQLFVCAKEDAWDDGELPQSLPETTFCITSGIAPNEQIFCPTKEVTVTFITRDVPLHCGNTNLCAFSAPQRVYVI